MQLFTLYMDSDRKQALNSKSGALGYFSYCRRVSDSQLSGEQSLLKSVCVYHTWRMLLQVLSLS